MGFNGMLAGTYTWIRTGWKGPKVVGIPYGDGPDYVRGRYPTSRRLVASGTDRRVLGSS